MTVAVDIYVAVQEDDFDVSSELQQMRELSTQVGAIASFVGVVRDINSQQTIASLELEHYPGMTQASIREIIQEAGERWPLLAARVIHRIGKLAPTEQIVLVAVSSLHRGEAFAACEFIMDYLKTRAPFWKKELTAEGEHWVDARSTDHSAAQRWSE